MTTADIFAQVVKSAMRIDRYSHPGPPVNTGPQAIAAAITATHDRLPGGSGVSETGVRAPKMEPCGEVDCPDGGWWDDEKRVWDHSHPTPPDPTGDAAMRPSRSDADLRLLEQSVDRFVASVGELVARSRSRGVPATWDEAVMDAGILDEWDAISSLEAAWGAKAVRRWVTNAGDALEDMERLWRGQQSRQPSQDEKHWRSGQAPGDLCDWHIAIHERYRRPRMPGKNICRDCVTLVDLGEGARPPVWLLEAEVDREGRPRVWMVALGRWLDELGIARDRSA